MTDTSDLNNDIFSEMAGKSRAVGRGATIYEALCWEIRLLSNLVDGRHG